MEKKNVWIVVGAGACGKSSLVRGLTGRMRFGRQEVEFEDGKILEIDTHIRSMQEKRWDIEKCLEVINESECTDVLLTLRNEEYNYCPSGSEYVVEISKRWNIKGVTFLGITDTFEYTPYIPADNQVHIEVPKNYTLNHIRATVCAKWKWK